jgi:hypothetical protein
MHLFAEGLRFADARSKRSAPLLEDCFQSLAQEFALRGSLKTEIADRYYSSSRSFASNHVPSFDARVACATTWTNSKCISRIWDNLYRNRASEWSYYER